MDIVEVDTSKVHDWESFHAVFSEAFGFPDFYGRNMERGSIVRRTLMTQLLA